MSREETMTRRKYIRTVAGVVVGLAAGTALGYAIPHEPPGHASKKILLIFSYHPEFSWVAEETRGVQDVLWDQGLLIEKFYMDTKRNTSSEWIEKVSADAAKKIKEFTPDLVIVFDDNACEFVAMKYIGDSIPFVFCGMNRDPKDYGFPAQNVTGVLERHHIKAAIDLLKRLVPGVRRVAIITDDNPTPQAFLAQVKETVLPVEIGEVYATNDFDAWKAKVRALQSNVDALGLFTYHTIKTTGSDTSLPGEDVLNWTLENSQLPEFAFFDFTVNGGGLCGVTISGYEQGKAAAEMAIKVINGTKPSDIPIESPEKGNPMVNRKRATELGIAIPEEVTKEVEIVG